jgi:hypothetical protein
MATSVPAAYANLRTGLLARAGMTGVGVHLTSSDVWAEDEQVCLGQATAPQAGAVMATGSASGIDETVTLSGYLFVARQGRTDADVAAALTRAGVLLTELAGQLAADPHLGGAIPDSFDPPNLTQVTWVPWLAEQDGISVVRVRIDWQARWATGI